MTHSLHKGGTYWGSDWGDARRLLRDPEWHGGESAHPTFSAWHTGFRVAWRSM